MTVEHIKRRRPAPTVIGLCSCGRSGVIVVGAGGRRAGYRLEHLDDAIDAIERIRLELELEDRDAARRRRELEDDAIVRRLAALAGDELEDGER